MTKKQMINDILEDGCSYSRRDLMLMTWGEVKQIWHIYFSGVKQYYNNARKKKNK